MSAYVHLTLPCAPRPLTDLLRVAPPGPRFYFESAQSPRATAGAGVTALLRAQGTGRFAHLQQQARSLFARLYTPPAARTLPPPALIGGGAFFADHAPTGGWDAFPSAALVLPRLTLTRHHEQTFLSINLPCLPDETLTQALQRAQREAQAALASLNALPPSEPAPPADWTCREPDRAAWHETVQRALAFIQSARLHKVVLARTLTVQSEHPIALIDLLQRLGETCPNCFRFLVEFQAGAAFAGATPERLISIQQGFLRTAAVAGSIRRGVTPAEDQALGDDLLRSVKNRHEHTLVTDYLRTRLAPFTANLNMPETPTLLRLPNIQHLYTPFEGNLRQGCGPLDVLDALHPTPAVGGMPLNAALDFIRRCEGFARGWYAGPIGWLDADGNADFAVAIRSALFHPRQMTLFGGAGIVAGSDPDREWDETSLKMQFLLNALQAVPA